MSRQFKNGSCSCWKSVDKQLEKHDAQLDLGFSFTGHHYLPVCTERLSSSRKAPPKMYASHCPFCGAELKKPKQEKE